MIRDMRNNEVIEEYKLKDYWHFYVASKVLNNTCSYKYKRTEDANVYLKPYSELFKYNFRSSIRSSSNFNSKKFSII